MQNDADNFFLQIDVVYQENLISKMILESGGALLSAMGLAYYYHHWLLLFLADYH